MAQTPILLIGYNRPNALLRRLKTIELLKDRNVHISLDGARSLGENPKIEEVRRIAEIWAEQSRHNVELHMQDQNLGIHRHLPVALGNFMASHNKVIVLEDDIEFTEFFVDFVESNIDIRSDIFAVQGFNPMFAKTFGRESGIPGSIYTRIPTVWGWAARADSIEFYLNFVRSRPNLKLIDNVIQEFASSISRDAFLRNAIRATWLQKMDRVLKDQGGSWDNWWVLASWASNQNLLMPELALSREEVNQSEGQTHIHTKDGFNYAPLSLISFDAQIDPKRVNKKIERAQLKVWGISRKYAWAYAIRIFRKIRFAISL